MPRYLVAGLVLIAGLLATVGGSRTSGAIVCAKPYHEATADGRCAWSCAQGTLPDPASGECVCQAGLSETGRDPIGRRICGAEPACTEPYRIRDTEGRCFWSCAPGSEPDPASGQCLCQAGLVETSRDQFGRRICEAAEACAEPYRLRSSDGQCLWSCAAGTRPDPASGECACQPGLAETGIDQFGRRVCGPAPGTGTGPGPGPPGPGPGAACQGPYHVATADGRCVWSCGEGTQPDPGSGQCVCQAGMSEVGTDQLGRRACAGGGACPGPYHVRTANGRCFWSCGRGTQPDPASGQCACQDGMAERGLDERGRRFCYAATDCPGPYRVEAADGRCEWSCGAGTSPHLASGQCRCDTGRRPAGTDEHGRRVCR